MRRTLGTMVVALLLGAGVFACSNPSVQDVPLGFVVTEGLLLLGQTDTTVGTVVLSSTAGNCRAFQAGANFEQIAGSDFLTFQLESLAPDLSLLPLGPGDYTILIPSVTGPQDAGLYAASVEYETNLGCDQSIVTGANSGTLTLNPFAVDAGGTSDVTFTAIFGYNRIKGAYSLNTCIIPGDAGSALDAGTCLLPGVP